MAGGGREIFIKQIFIDLLSLYDTSQSLLLGLDLVRAVFNPVCRDIKGERDRKTKQGCERERGGEISRERERERANEMKKERELTIDYFLFYGIN